MTLRVRQRDGDGKGVCRRRTQAHASFKGERKRGIRCSVDSQVCAYRCDSSPGALLIF